MFNIGDKLKYVKNTCGTAADIQFASKYLGQVGELIFVEPDDYYEDGSVLEVLFDDGTALFFAQEELVLA